MVLLAVDDIPPAVAVGLISAVAVMVTGIVTATVAFLLNRRSADDTHQQADAAHHLDLIEASQAFLKDALKTAQDQIKAQTAQIKAQSVQIGAQSTQLTDLRAQVDAMRVELADALRHASECEEARVAQGRELVELRAQLNGDSAQPIAGDH
jgi:septal ring factor EnvC (AmiA/AmiB activator)